MMPHSHLAAFIEDQDAGGVFANIAAIADGVLDASGDNLRGPAELPFLAAAFHGADSVNTGLGTPRARLTWPDLAKGPRLEVNPRNGNAVEPASPVRWLDMWEAPVPVKPGDIINAQANRDPGAADTDVLLAWFSKGPMPPMPPPAGSFWTRFSVPSFASVAHVWSRSATVTPDQTLPEGIYELYASVLYSTEGIAHRVNLPGEAFKPGWLSFDASEDVDSAYKRRIGSLGAVGRFKADQLFSVDVLDNVAATEARPMDVLIRKVA